MWYLKISNVRSSQDHHKEESYDTELSFPLTLGTLLSRIWAVCMHCALDKIHTNMLVISVSFQSWYENVVGHNSTSNYM